MSSLVKAPPFYEPGLEDLTREGLNKRQLTFTCDINQAITQSGIIFICVGTPPDESGQADMSQVEEASRFIAHNLNGYKLMGIAGGKAGPEAD